MADLDTRSKRASSVGLALFFVLAPVAPDATIAQQDRQHNAVSYSGILAVFSLASTPWQVNSGGVLTIVDVNTGGVLALADVNTNGVQPFADVNTSGASSTLDVNTDGISVGV